jgi:hypothetical protein
MPPETTAARPSRSKQAREKRIKLKGLFRIPGHFQRRGKHRRIFRPAGPCSEALALLARHGHEGGRDAHDLVTLALRTSPLGGIMLGDGLDPLERLPALLTTICVGGHGLRLHTRRARSHEKDRRPPAGAHAWLAMDPTVKPGLPAGRFAVVRSRGPQSRRRPCQGEPAKWRCPSFQCQPGEPCPWPYRRRSSSRSQRRWSSRSPRQCALAGGTARQTCRWRGAGRCQMLGLGCQARR